MERGKQLSRKKRAANRSSGYHPNWIEKGGLLVGVATVVVAVIALFGSGSGGDPSAAGTRVVDLQLVDMSVGEAGPSIRPHMRVDITLHNLGGRLAVIDGARLKIDRIYRLQRCASQDDLPVNHVYGVVLPIDAEPGRTIDTTLHQTIGPDEADRFGIDVSASSAPPDGAIDIFEFDLSLRYDGARIPKSLGTVQVWLPMAAADGEYYLTKKSVALIRRWARAEPAAVPLWEEALPCWRSNTPVLQQALRDPATRPPELDALAGALVSPTPVWRE